MDGRKFGFGQVDRDVRPTDRTVAEGPFVASETSLRRSQRLQVGTGRQYEGIQIWKINFRIRGMKNIIISLYFCFI
jgi:hypothetical protein